MIVLQVLLDLSTSSCQILLSNSSRSTQLVYDFYKELLQQLMQDQRYASILLFHADNADYPNDCQDLTAVISSMEIPIFLLDNLMDVRYMKHFNNDIVTFACLNSVENYNFTMHLAVTLDIMRYTRIILQVHKKVNVSALQKFFQYCHQLQILNVMLIYTDFFNTKLYYLYTVFPTFEVKLHYYKHSHRSMIFPQRLRDLKGYKLRTVVDHVEPRSMEYLDNMGKSQLRGYIGRFIATLAEVLNASLVMPLNVPVNVELNYSQIMSCVHNNSIDIATSIVAFFPWDDLHELSYPVDIEKWCILIPIEQPMEIQQLFLLIMQSELMLIVSFLVALFTLVLFAAKYCAENYHFRQYQWPQFILNDMALRGVLGQTFIELGQRTLAYILIYCMLLLTGLTISSVFGSYLLSYLTQPLPQSPIRSYDDLVQSPMKFAIPHNDFNYLHNVTNGSLAKYYRAFHIMDTFQEFSQLRESLDRRYAYSTTSSYMYKISSYEERHSVKLVRINENMCPVLGMHWFVPLTPNSYYRQPLNLYTLRVWQSGLLDYWRSKTYADIVEAGQHMKLNVTLTTAAVPLTVRDLMWIWIIYGSMCLLAVLVFLLELVICEIFTSRRKST